MLVNEMHLQKTRVDGVLTQKLFFKIQLHLNQDYIVELSVK